APPALFTLSLHDALPIYPVGRVAVVGTTLAALGIAIAVLVTSAGGESAKRRARGPITACNGSAALCSRRFNEVFFPGTHNSMSSSEEHTSELQSRVDLVC